MKMTKVLAAALAGTMVLGATVAVSAETLTGVAWWDATNQTGCNATINGDGEWTYTIKLGTTQDEEGNDILAGGAFCIEVNDANGYYITTTSANDGWTAGEGVTGTVSGTTAGGNGYVVGAAQADMSPVDTYTVKVTRSGNDWTFMYYEGTDTKICQIKCVDANLDGDIDLHFMAQIGTYDVTLSGTGIESSSAEESETPAASESETPAASESEAPATTEKTGDAAPIVAVVVALAGCAAIAFASKKRFAK